MSTNTTVEKINEWSNFDPSLKAQFEQMGYKYLGKGVDQLAFIDAKRILKIFGMQSELTSKQYSPDQKMFFIRFSQI